MANDFSQTHQQTNHQLTHTMKFTVTKNIHGPGYHVRNPDKQEVCWVFDQGDGTQVLNKRRADAIAELLTQLETNKKETL